MAKRFQYLFLLLLIINSIISSLGSPSSKDFRNILLINSYHQGNAWTDSLTQGIIKELKQFQNYNLNIESLNSKQFGKSKFEIEKKYIQDKYSGTVFDGVLITDNDALDFAIKYQDDLFPGVPIVFSGISNPEDYSLNNSLFYGIKESGSSDFVIGFVRSLLPKVKRLLIIADKSTTGLIYRREFNRQAAIFDKLTISYPEKIDVDSIYHLVGSASDYDAIYFIGLGIDENGQIIDFVPVVHKICQLAKVPVFINDPIFNGKGVVGGIFQRGTIHGMESVKLLDRLINTSNRDTISHVYVKEQGYFFDQLMLDKFKISDQKIPQDAIIINKKAFLNKGYLGILLGILTFLSIVVVVLSIVNRRRKIEQKRNKKQLQKIEVKKNELEEAHQQLSALIGELENTNDRLKESNLSLSEAKKKAEESDNLKSAFLANVSHEIRTPLNSIVGFSSLLGEPDLSETTRNSYVELIESNTESLLVLIDEIIDLSKIEAQQLIIKKQNFNIDVLLNELVHILTQEHKKSEVELRLRKISESKELFAFSDRVRIKQIFINLLSNAYKFTDSGFIEFGYFQTDENEITFFVRDTGIGIKQEFQEVIFDRFRKLNNDGNRVYRGTGLGLSITKKLVELLGGHISVNSEPEKGTSFFFTLDGLELREIKA